MPEIKTCYKVNNFEFDNMEDAEKFNAIYNEFKNEEQLKQIYLGIKNKINYKIYANQKFDFTQMKEIRQGIEKGLDVSIYAKPELNYLQMGSILKALEKILMFRIISVQNLEQL